ncbi:MAG: flagellar basal body L-ring protein FlgH [Candidatus Omnitrophica bacterium]|nr:flagellar basal body L-ring protein FlgH [Candidatus Omnitrophota bacterium]
MKVFRVGSMVLSALIMLGQGATPASAVSLWNSEGSLGTLFVDQRARRVGDIITVLISEQSSATSTASTSTGRNSTIDDKVESWFSIKGLLKIFTGGDAGTQRADSGNLPQAKLSAKHDFKGTGTTSRNDTFSARLTCRVMEILPNRNFVIEGRQSVAVNAEEQIIVVRGIIRPEDVSANNTVYSYNVADAKISYLGKGAIGDKQRRGVLQWLGDKVWPF